MRTKSIHFQGVCEDQKGPPTSKGSQAINKEQGSWLSISLAAE